MARSSLQILVPRLMFVVEYDMETREKVLVKRETVGGDFNSGDYRQNGGMLPRETAP